MNIETCYAIIDKLHAATSRDCLKAAGKEFCEAVNLEYFLMGVLSKDSLYAPKVSVVSNYPQPWLELYFKESQLKNDPVVTYMLNRNTPIRWDRLMQNELFQSAEFEVLMTKAKEYGLNNGISIPICSVSGEAAVMSLATRKEGIEGNSLLEQALPFAHTFATHFFEKFNELLLQQELSSMDGQLTERENQCLFWACEGKTAWEISQIIEISERTVLFHLNNSAKKLNATSRQHAVAIAMKKGLIKPHL